jgi:MFS-type transporter involved in bile tolerance (Atg22 family)
MWPGSFSKASRALPRGGTALFALLALAGDMGGTLGPSFVGLGTEFTGDGIQGGLLAASVFPVLLVVSLLLIRRGS